MADHEFEWDDDKAALNYAKHGVSFEAAREVFKDAFAVETLDDRVDYREERFSIIGWPVAFSCSWPTPCEEIACA